MFLFSLYFIFFTKKTFNYVILPFKKGFPDLERDDSYFTYLSYNNIYSPLKIGTPPQTISLNIEFRNYPFFLSKYDTKTHFNESNSNSYQKTKTLSPYISSMIYNKCFLSKDKFSLNINNTIQDVNLPFLLATDFKQNYLINNMPPPGVIGLNFFDDSVDKDKNQHFIKMLKENNIISTYIWSIKYNHNNDEGEILIGKKPHEIYPKIYKENIIKWTKTEIEKTLYGWEMIFDQVYYGKYVEKGEEKKIDFKNNNEYKLDENSRNVKLLIEHGMIKGSLEFQNYLKSHFIKDNKCNEYKEGIAVYYGCDLFAKIENFPSLYFIHRELNYTFVLDYKDLIIKYNNKYYLLVYFYNLNNNDKYWNFGKPFFKKYQLIFDHDRRSIGIYNGIENNSFKVGIIILFTIITIILGCISYVFYRRKFRKKRLNEIDENYDYVPAVI